MSTGTRLKQQVVDPGLVRQLQETVGDRLERAQRLARAGGRVVLSGEHERQYARQLISEALTEHAGQLVQTGRAPLEWALEQDLAEGVYARLFGAGRLQHLIDDERVENIDINACDEVYVSYADGSRVRAEPVAESDEELVELVQTLASYAGLNSRPFDAANPELDLRLPDGSRLSALMQVTAHPTVSIRRNRFTKVELADLVGNDTLTPEVAAFLTAAVRARFNLVIAGATNAGKTTLLRALTGQIPAHERIITVERALELGLRQQGTHDDVVEMEERVANSEGTGAITMAQLVRRTLRMNPDRVIVGEVLGPEIVTMLNAMSQGNDGSLSTIHARTAREVFNRISTYALSAEERLPAQACHQLIAGGLDYVVFLSRDAHRRRVHSILEINGHDPAIGVAASEIFTLGPDGHAVQCADVAISRTPQLQATGWTPTDLSGWQP